MRPWVGCVSGGLGKGEQLNEWPLSMKEEDTAKLRAPRYSTQQPSLSREVYLFPLIPNRKPTAKRRFIRIEMMKSQ